MKAAMERRREEIIRLVKTLPHDELHVARRFIEYLRDLRSDAVLRAFTGAPIDDEPETPDEAAAVAVAREEVARGETVPWEKIRLRATRVARRNVRKRIA